MIYYDEENEEHYDDFEEFGRCEARKEKESLSSRGPCDPENLGGTSKIFVCLLLYNFFDCILSALYI